MKIVEEYLSSVNDPNQAPLRVRAERLLLRLIEWQRKGWHQTDLMPASLFVER